MNVSIRAIQAIMENAIEEGKNVRVGNIERALGYYRQSWGDDFSKVTGLSPASYMRYFRMRCICQDLVTSKHSLLDISEYYGRSISYFCRDFKKLIGMTPGEYRKLNHNGRAVVLHSVFWAYPFLTDFTSFRPLLLK